MRKHTLLITIISVTLFGSIIRCSYGVGHTEGYSKGVSDGIDSMITIHEKYQEAEALRYINKHKRMDSLFTIVKGLRIKLDRKIDSLDKIKR